MHRSEQFWHLVKSFEIFREAPRSRLRNRNLSRNKTAQTNGSLEHRLKALLRSGIKLASKVLSTAGTKENKTKKGRGG